MAREPTARTTALVPALPGELVAGDRVGRYRVLGEVGRGATGVVLAAWDLELDRKVALKWLHGALDGDARRRLVSEAQALARLEHANVIRVHDVGSHEGRPYMVTEFVEGTTLVDFRGGVPDVLAVMLAAGHGLAAAHDVGLVHRDFKPANVMLGRDGRARVTDFGLARVGADAPPAEPITGVDADLAASITRSDAVAGTPAYLAPELFTGAAADARSDQFAFCVALYELLWGQRPFAGDNLFALADAVCSGRVRTPPARPLVPLAVRRAVLRGLARDPAARHRDMRALLAAIAPHPWWRWPAVTAAVVAPVVIAVAVVASHQRAEVAVDYCAELDDRLAEIWNPSRAEAVDAALRTRAVGYAANVADRVGARLDEHAAALHEAERALCEADPQVAVIERAAAEGLCLHRRREELRGLVDLLERADADLLDHAVQATLGLGDVAACHAVGAPGPRPGRAAPEVVLELEGAVARAHVAVEAWRDDAAVREAEAARALAVASGVPWYEAEADLILAHVADRHGDLTAAQPQFDAAFSAAIADGHHVVATQAALGLSSSYATHGRHDDALRWLAHAEAALSAVPAEARGRLPAQVANARASAWYHHGDFAEARAEFEHALALYGSDSDVQSGYLLLNIGLSESNLGHYEESVSWLERALASDEALFGPEHPSTLRDLNALSHVEVDRGNFDRAIEYARRAIDSARADTSRPQPRLSHLYSNLGSAYFNAGRLDEAERVYEAALDNALRLQPDDPMLLATIYNNLGVLDVDRHRLDRAELHYGLAYQGLSSAFGLDHPATGMLETNLAMALVEGGKLDEGQTILEGALSRMEARLGPDHPDLALSLAELGRVAHKRGDDAAAIPLFERALALRLDAGGDPIELADTSWGLAISLDALDAVAGTHAHAERVRSLTRQAVQSYRAAGGERLVQADEAEAWLAARRPTRM